MGRYHLVQIILMAAMLGLSASLSMPRSRFPTCSDNCTLAHQNGFAQELRNHTNVDLEIIDLSQLVSFMQSLYSKPDSGLLYRMCNLNQQLSTCLQYCPDSLTKEIHMKKSSIYFLMCDAAYKSYAGCLMNSSFRSSSFMDRIETVCEERVSQRHVRSIWERLCQMARCRVLCLKQPTIERCGLKAYETAKKAALAAIDEYEGTYLSQSVSPRRVSARSGTFDTGVTGAPEQPEGNPSARAAYKENFETFCDRKTLFEENGQYPACV